MEKGTLKISSLQSISSCIWHDASCVRLTGEVIQKLTSEVKVLGALGQEPESKKHRQREISATLSVTLRVACRLTSG